MRLDFAIDRQTKVKTFLKDHDVSKGLLVRVKFRGGNTWVSGAEQNVIYLSNIGDAATIEIPDEEEYEMLVPVKHDLNIAYEDGHSLIISKPYDYASIPSILHSNTTANFVKYYYLERNYPNKQVHIMTRLDKDMSGLMLFAEHGYTHARLDKQLQNKTIERRYYVSVSGRGELVDKGEVIVLAARSDDSTIIRYMHPSGKYTHTSYEVMARFGEVALVDIHLHAGRTHQVRVHFSHIGFPLLGDDMYGGSTDYGVTCQALHCHYPRSVDPYTNEEIIQTTSLTDDFDGVIMELQQSQIEG